MDVPVRVKLNFWRRYGSVPYVVDSSGWAAVCVSNSVAKINRSNRHESKRHSNQMRLWITPNSSSPGKRFFSIMYVMSLAKLITQSTFCYFNLFRSRNFSWLHCGDVFFVFLPLMWMHSNFVSSTVSQSVLLNNWWTIWRIYLWISNDELIMAFERRFILNTKLKFQTKNLRKSREDLKQRRFFNSFETKLLKNFWWRLTSWSKCN